MGFVIAQVVREFHIPISSLLAMPKKHFFWLYAMMPRVRAERDLMMLRVMRVSQADQEGFEKITQEIQSEMGVIYERQFQTPKIVKIEECDEGLDPEFDREGLRALKIKHGV